MICVGSKIIKEQKNFYNGCVFHPTDAVEDSWGRRNLDRMAKDKAIDMVRIYAMFEDIVYYDHNGEVAYDFRINDLRLDYLVEKGFRIMIAYGMIPEILATDKEELSNVSKNKTRYKGKMLFISKPNNTELWEEICYEYTNHIVERYGEDTVSGWYLHCYNEPDIASFFMRNIPGTEDENEKSLIREKEYIKMYRGFVNGVTRVSENLFIGGPALAGRLVFLDAFLKDVKREGLRLDYIAMHNYGGLGFKSAMEKGFCTDYWMEKHEEYMEVIRNNGFCDTELVYDEWGMAANGFLDVDECPAFIARETEVFSAYYVKLISQIIERGYKLSHLMICLSGQHEMKYDFTGFRNFFSLNFFAKPIYNAHIMASRLYSGLVEARCNDNLFVIPTKNEKDEYAVLLSYSSHKFGEDIPEYEEEVVFDNISDNQIVTIYCIDKENTNPYRLYERMGLDRNLSEENIKTLREEGNIKPFATHTAKEKITLKLTPNSTYLILTENKE